MNLATLIDNHFLPLKSIAENVMPYSEQNPCEHWLCSTTVDYCPADDSEDENEYILSFSLTQHDNRITACMDLGYWVMEIGFQKIKTITLTDITKAQVFYENLHGEWEMHKDALSIGQKFIERAFQVKEEMLSQGNVITWMDRQDDVDI